MSLKNYGRYFQGAMITISDFDPVKVVLYMCKIYDVAVSEELKEAIMADDISEEQYSYLYKNLDVKCGEYSLEKLRDNLLNDYEINDICCDDAEVSISTNHVSAMLLRDIEGEFIYDDNDKTLEIVNDCIIMSFDIPLMWRMKEYEIPVDKRLAVFWLQQAGKSLLKDNINWEERLGELNASIVAS